MYDTEQDHEQTLQLDPSLVVSLALAEAELLRLETDVALAKMGLGEHEDPSIHDLSLLGR